MSKPLAFVVEDDPDLAELNKEALQSAGFEVEVIDNGARAVDRLAETAPSLVVLDINLPLTSGENVLRQIRSEPLRYANTRVIIVTADAQRAEQLRDQADLVLTKPVTYSQLRDLAQRMVPAAKIHEEIDEPSDADTQRLNRIDPDDDPEDKDADKSD